MRDSPPVALPIPVKIGITLLSLQSPDESSLHYEVEFVLHQTWDDPRLAHIKEKEGRALPFEGSFTPSKDLEARHLLDQAWNFPKCFA